MDKADTHHKPVRRWIEVDYDGTVIACASAISGGFEGEGRVVLIENREAIGEGVIEMRQAFNISDKVLTKAFSQATLNAYRLLQDQIDAAIGV